MGLSKQRKLVRVSLFQGCHTALFASQHNLFCSMWPDPAKGLSCLILGNFSKKLRYEFKCWLYSIPNAGKIVGILNRLETVCKQFLTNTSCVISMSNFTRKQSRIYNSTDKIQCKEIHAKAFLFKFYYSTGLHLHLTYSQSYFSFCEVPVTLVLGLWNLLSLQDYILRDFLITYLANNGLILQGETGCGSFLRIEGLNNCVIVDSCSLPN